MRPHLQIIAALVALPVLALAQTSGPSDLYHMLIGVDGSQARVTASGVPQAATEFVSVCFSVPASHRNGKGLGLGSNAPILAAPGQNRCLTVAPTSRNLTLYSRSAQGAPTRSMALTLDLKHYAGHVVQIEWIAEASP